MPPPPFVTWLTTVSLSGWRSSRLGPVEPVDPAAARVWQLPQPALAKTSAPAALPPPPVVVSVGVFVVVALESSSPPQPTPMTMNVTIAAATNIQVRARIRLLLRRELSSGFAAVRGN
jgi:hypothetical protein